MSSNKHIELPSGWELKILHEIASTSIGEFVIKTKHVTNGEYPVYNGGKSYTGFYNEFNNEGNKIIISARGAYAGHVNFSKIKFWAGNSCYSIGIKKENIVEIDFLFYYVKNNENNFLLNQQAANIPSVSKKDVENFKISLPPLPEQRAIANILSTWDTAIQTTQALFSQKEQEKKWLMQNLLTGKKRLTGFSGEWKEIHIRDIANEVSIKNKSDKQLTVLSCTKYNGLVPSLEYFGRKIFADDLSTYKIVPLNHFAYATNHIEEGSIGYQERFEEALISPMYTVFKTNESVNDTFMYRLLKSHPLIYQYQNRMEGSIDRRGGLRWDAFAIIKIKLPSIEEQSAIAQVLQTADKEIELLKAKLEQQKLQKKGLMQVLLTGKVRVKTMTYNA